MRSIPDETSEEATDMSMVPVTIPYHSAFFITQFDAEFGMDRLGVIVLIWIKSFATCFRAFCPCQFSKVSTIGL